jgi:hypothetical protein
MPPPPPPTSGEQTPAAITFSGNFSDGKKKKKKRSGHWGWPRSTPTARGRDPATLSGHVSLSGEPVHQEKKIHRSGHWVWPGSTPSGLGVAEIQPNGQGVRNLANTVAILVSPTNETNFGEPKNRF